MKRIAVLGSTGSIGLSALRIIAAFPKRFKAVALSAHSRTDALLGQCRAHRPDAVCVTDPVRVLACRRGLERGTRLYAGQDGLLEMIERCRADVVVMAISGSAALPPLLGALDRGIDVALANKEALVMAGDIVMRRAGHSGARILPVDSEQSAIWQCLDGKASSLVKRIVLTASGGPLRGMRREELEDVKLERVLRHPRWKMGRKITVDSSTMMNKGLEFIETMMLFGVPADKIEVVVHPESVIHSMVEFCDGIIMAQLSVPDMRLPLYYALSYPERFPTSVPGVDFFRLKAFHFERPHLGRFPCLRLAVEAARAGGTLPAVLNAANEVAVDAYLSGSVRFGDIPRIISGVMDAHRSVRGMRLEDIIAADARARSLALELVAARGGRGRSRGGVC